jgi:hypothetical protein
MLQQIVLSAVTSGEQATTFRLCIDESVIANDLNAFQAQILVGAILDRIELPTTRGKPTQTRMGRPSQPNPATARPSFTTGLHIGRQKAARRP